MNVWQQVGSRHFQCLRCCYFQGNPDAKQKVNETMNKKKKNKKKEEEERKVIKILIKNYRGTPSGCFFRFYWHAERPWEISKESHREVDVMLNVIIKWKMCNPRLSQSCWKSLWASAKNLPPRPWNKRPLEALLRRPHDNVIAGGFVRQLCNQVCCQHFRFFTFLVHSKIS